MATSQPAILGGTAIKPVERHGWEKVKFFLWDPKAGAVMGRTPKSWALITLFYIIYYSCLAAFWALMLFIFFCTINDESPKYIGEESLIGTSPGVGIRPAQPEETLDSSMFIFNKDSKATDAQGIPGYYVWSEQINQFLSRYNTGKNKKCSPTARSGRNPYPCRFDTALLGPCGQKGTGFYGYKDGQPCVYLKLNKLMKVPNDHYNDPDDPELPEDFPNELPEHIRKQTNKEQVWVNCEGENPADKEAMGPIEYHPKARGFPGHFFPYKGDNDTHPYESPLVAVRFRNPRVGQLLHVECRGWAKNIEYNRMDRKGMVRFELLVLDDDHADVFGTEESYS